MSTPTGRTRGAQPQRGFTIVEIVVAMIILTVGVLGMAGTTAFVVRQVTLAQVTTRRAAAVQDVVERLRAVEYQNMASGQDSIGPFHVRWVVADDGARSATITVLTLGPGLATVGGTPFPMLQPSVSDTFVYRRIRP